MTNREKLDRLTRDLTESQLASAVAVLEAHLMALEEALDDAFCMRLYEEARANDDDDDETMDFDEFIKTLGLDEA